jgi:hypothetical protein
MEWRAVAISRNRTFPKNLSRLPIQSKSVFGWALIASADASPFQRISGSQSNTFAIRMAACSNAERNSPRYAHGSRVPDALTP